jgi:hypothetical protein
MKTKAFLLATAGSTVDGRTITDADIDQMASSYDPKTYGARVNIEHIRGMSGQAPFNAYGDVESVSVGTVDVNFNGKTEKRKALYGVLDVTDNAKALNDANQKVYPSIEILDNFGGKGFAYLGGLALTDSPAAIATERLKFNRQLPGSIKYSSDTAALLEFEDDAATPEAKGLMASMGAMFDKFAAVLSPAPKVDPVDPPVDPAKPATFDFSALRPMFDEMVQTFSTTLENVRKEFREETDRIALQVKKQGEEQEHTPAGNFSRRTPAGGGSATNYDGIW